MTAISRGMPRSMSSPEVGWWLLRRGKNTPVVPARIWIEREPEHAMLPIDPWPNSETRILGIFAEIAGKPVDVDEVWLRKLEPISETEFKFRMSEQSWLQTYTPHDPLAQSDKPIALRDAPLPF